MKALQSNLEWMDLRSLTNYAAISERTLRSWIHAPADALPASRVGTKIMVRRRDFDKYLENHKIIPLQSVDVDAVVRELLSK